MESSLLLESSNISLYTIISRINEYQIPIKDKQHLICRDVPRLFARVEHCSYTAANQIEFSIRNNLQSDLLSILNYLRSSESKKRNNEKTESEDALCYSIFISFILGFDRSLFLNAISRIPLLNTDLAVSISVSSGKSVTSRYFLGPVVVTSTE
jgi:hypothetical protein